MGITRQKSKLPAIVAFIAMCVAALFAALAFISLFTQDEKLVGVVVFAVWAIVTLVLARVFGRLWHRS